MRALFVFVLASLPYVAQAQEVNQVSTEGRGRYSITMNASGSLSIDKSLAWRPVPRKDE